MEASNPTAVLPNFKSAVAELYGAAEKYDDRVVDVVTSALLEFGVAAGFDDVRGLINDALSPSSYEPETTTSNGWPAAVSIKSTSPPVEKFIPELLPDEIRDYVMDVADRQQAPPNFAAVTALCGVAAVVGNRIRIRPKQSDDWEVVPNLWGAIVGRPSAMKSPAMQADLCHSGRPPPSLGRGDLECGNRRRTIWS